jgi:hypothetical protein
MDIEGAKKVFFKLAWVGYAMPVEIEGPDIGSDSRHLPPDA